MAEPSDPVSGSITIKLGGVQESEQPNLYSRTLSNQQKNPVVKPLNVQIHNETETQESERDVMLSRISKQDIAVILLQVVSLVEVACLILIYSYLSDFEIRKILLISVIILSRIIKCVYFLLKKKVGLALASLIFLDYIPRFNELRQHRANNESIEKSDKRERTTHKQVSEAQQNQITIMIEQKHSEYKQKIEDSNAEQKLKQKNLLYIDLSKKNSKQIAQLQKEDPIKASPFESVMSQAPTDIEGGQRFTYDIPTTNINNQEQQQQQQGLSPIRSHVQFNSHSFQPTLTTIESERLNQNLQGLSSNQTFHNLASLTNKFESTTMNQVSHSRNLRTLSIAATTATAIATAPAIVITVPTNSSPKQESTTKAVQINSNKETFILKKKAEKAKNLVKFTNEIKETFSTSFYENKTDTEHENYFWDRKWSVISLRLIDSWCMTIPCLYISMSIFSQEENPSSKNVYLPILYACIVLAAIIALSHSIFLNIQYLPFREHMNSHKEGVKQIVKDFFLTLISIIAQVTIINFAINTNHTAVILFEIFIILVIQVFVFLALQNAFSQKSIVMTILLVAIAFLFAIGIFFCFIIGNLIVMLSRWVKDEILEEFKVYMTLNVDLESDSQEKQSQKQQKQSRFQMETPNNSKNVRRSGEPKINLKELKLAAPKLKTIERGFSMNLLLFIVQLIGISIIGGLSGSSYSGFSVIYFCFPFALVSVVVNIIEFLSVNQFFASVKFAIKECCSQQMEVVIKLIDQVKVQEQLVEAASANCEKVRKEYNKHNSDKKAIVSMQTKYTKELKEVSQQLKVLRTIKNVTEKLQQRIREEENEILHFESGIQECNSLIAIIDVKLKQVTEVFHKAEEKLNTYKNEHKRLGDRIKELQYLYKG